MLNCLIIDDEPLARQHIANYISRVNDLKLVGSVRNPVIGKNVLDNEAVDLIFLDIKMQQMSGLDFLKKNAVFQQVIVISAYPEYAIEGFELEVTDYLMKPVTFERFLKAVDKVRVRIGGSENIRTVRYQPDFIYVKHNQRYEKVLLADILYIESMLNYVRIITSAGRYMVYSSLRSIYASLPADRFIRIHKSYIAAVSQITSVSPVSLSIGKTKLPVSRANKKALMELIARTGIPYNG